MTREQSQAMSAAAAPGSGPAWPSLSWQELAHLSRDWDALAARIEREHDPDSPWWRRAYTLRECASQLRARLGLQEQA
jgi:hypothetical protein